MASTTFATRTWIATNRKTNQAIAFEACLDWHDAAREFEKQQGLKSGSAYIAGWSMERQVPAEAFVTVIAPGALVLFRGRRKDADRLYRFACAYHGMCLQEAKQFVIAKAARHNLNAKQQQALFAVLTGDFCKSWEYCMKSLQGWERQGILALCN